MKSKGSVVLLLAFLVLMSCETDFVTEANGKMEPVVYAVIDPQDEIHSIRLSRPFRGGNDAFLSAHNSDSSAFQQAEVKLEFYTETGWKYNEFLFEPVGEWSKDAGVFGGGGEQLFQLDHDLLDRFIPGTHVIMNIRIPGMPDITSSLIKHLEPIKITAPKQGLMSYISLYPPNPVKIHFTDLAHFSDYELSVRLYYTNVFLDGTEEVKYAEKRYHRFSENNNPRRYSDMIVALAGDNVFAALAQDIPTDNNVEFRRIGEVQFWVFTGSPEFYQYQYLNQMATDLAGSPITNLVNGIGVFALKYHHSRSGYKLDMITQDSLVNGRFTRGLRFSKW